MSKHDTYCKRVDYETIIRGFNDEGELALCCKSQHPLPLATSTLDDLKKVKEDLKNGIRNPHCQFCWIAEDEGRKSWRQIGNDLENWDYHTIELYMNNTCDLACIYCSPKYSSSWQQEISNLPEESAVHIAGLVNDFYFKKRTKKVNHVPKALDIVRYAGSQAVGQSHTTQIVLLGGEPLLTPFIKKNIVDDIIEAFYETATEECKLKLGIVTNANTPDDIIDKTIEMISLSKAKHKNLEVFLSVSIESTGKMAEFIRHGLKWSQFEKNLNKWLASGNSIAFSTAVNIISWFDIEKFFEYTFNMAKQHSVQIGYRFNVAEFPDYLSIALLPPKFKYKFENIRSIINENKEYIKGGELALTQLYQQINDAEILYGKNENDPVIKNRGFKYFHYLKTRRKVDVAEVCSEVAHFFGVDNDVFCVAANNERIVKANIGIIFPCVASHGVRMADVDIDEHAKAINTGVEQPACHSCWKAEADGKQSVRQQRNKMWSNPFHGNSHVEIMFSNECNSACIYCNRGNSSAWANEIKNSTSPVPKSLTYIDDNGTFSTDENKKIAFEVIKRVAEDPTKNACIGMFGGEPLINLLKNDEPRQIATHFFKHAKLNNGRRVLRYDISTSLNVNTDEFLKIIEYFKKLKEEFPDLNPILQPSFESTGNNFNFVRWGNNWERFDTNLTAWLTETDFDVEVKTAINIVSLADTVNFLKYLNDKSRDIRPMEVRIEYVHGPKYLNISILDDMFKRHLGDVFTFFETADFMYFKNTDQMISNFKDAKEMIGSLSEEDVKRLATESLEFFNWINSSRGVNIQDVNPELYHYLVKMSEN